MARIEINTPQFDVPVVQLPSPGTAQADAYESIGKLADRGYTILDERAKADGELRAAQKLAALQREEYDAIEQANESGQVTEGFTRDRDAAVGARVQELSESAENQYERDAIARGAIPLGQNVNNRSHVVEAAANEARRKTALDQTFTDSLNIVSRDPSQLDAQRQRLKETIDGAFLSVPAKEEYRGKLSLFTEEAIHAVDPLTGMKLLNDPKFANDILPGRKRVIQNHLEANLDRKEQNTRSRIAFAQNQEDRARRDAGDAAAKEGWRLSGTGELSPEWVNNNERVLDTNQFRLLNELLRGGGGTDSFNVLNAIYKNMYVAGQDQSLQILDAVELHQITPERGHSLLEDNKQMQGVQSPVVKARSYIAEMFSPDPTTNIPFIKQSLAQSMDEFDRMYADDPTQDPMELARKVVKRNAMIDFQSIALTMPLPRFAAGGRANMDIEQTQIDTLAHFMELHNDDAAAVEKDPKYIEQLRLIDQWEKVQKKKLQGTTPTEGGTQLNRQPKP